MFQRVLVTGAGGFIGSHLAEVLATRGSSVRALVHYNAERSIGNLRFVVPDILDRIEIVFGDLTDAEFLKRLIDRCDTIFHLGAMIAIPHSYSAPRSYVDVNIGGTLNLLEAVREVGIARFVHTSTSEVYGSARYVPIDEKHPLQAQSPYSATKIGADKLVEAYRASFGLPTVIVRPFNTYGPRQSARAVIPTVIGQALGHGPIRLGALTPVRDMTFVSDTVAGFIAAAEGAGLDGGTYNLGSGTGAAIRDIAALILRLMQVDRPIELDQQRLRPTESEVDRLISSNQAFVEASGWTPQVSLEEGLSRTINFFRHHPDLLPHTEYVT